MMPQPLIIAHQQPQEYYLRLLIRRLDQRISKLSEDPQRYPAQLAFWKARKNQVLSKISQL